MPGDSENTRRRVLAILGGLGVLVHAEHTAELACHFCEGHRARLVFVYPIIVPLALPLDAALPEQERDARDAMARGMSVAAQCGCDAEARVIRHRRQFDAARLPSTADQYLSLDDHLAANLRRRLTRFVRVRAEDTVRNSDAIFSKYRFRLILV